MCRGEPGLEVYRGRPVLQQPSVVKGHCDTRARVVCCSSRLFLPFPSPRPPLFLLSSPPRRTRTLGIADKLLLSHAYVAPGSRPSLPRGTLHYSDAVRRGYLAISSIHRVDKLDALNCADKRRISSARRYPSSRFSKFFFHPGDTAAGLFSLPITTSVLFL